jgi:hypothetical protein
LLRQLLDHAQAQRVELQAMHSEIRELRGLVEASKSASLSDADAELLALVAEFVADQSFATRQIIARSKLQAGAALAEAMRAAKVNDAKSLGKLFQKVQGHELGGLRLERQGEDNGGAIWRVRVSRE